MHLKWISYDENSPGTIHVAGEIMYYALSVGVHSSVDLLFFIKVWKIFMTLNKHPILNLIV